MKKLTFPLLLLVILCACQDEIMLKQDTEDTEQKILEEAPQSSELRSFGVRSIDEFLEQSIAQSSHDLMLQQEIKERQDGSFFLGLTPTDAEIIGIPDSLYQRYQQMVDSLNSSKQL